MPRRRKVLLMSVDALAVNQATSRPSQLKWYALALVVLAVLRFAVGFLAAPPAVAMALSLLLGAVFILVPIAALYAGADHPWRPAPAVGLLVGGAALHLGTILWVRANRPTGLPLLLADVAQNSAVLIWCLGLGVLISLIIREKNMLPAIALFLAGLDIFLILSPLTPQRQFVEQNPEAFSNLAMSTPRVGTEAAVTTAKSGINFDLFLIGPADLFIAAVLFAVMFRFSMQYRRTAIWLGPALVAYMALVGLTGLPLPALVPIGLVFAICNWREFKLSRDEKQATWVVAVLALGFAGWGIYNAATYRPPARPAVPLQTESGAEPQAPADSPAPSASGQSR